MLLSERLFSFNHRNNATAASTREAAGSALSNKPLNKQGLKISDVCECPHHYHKSIKTEQTFSLTNANGTENNTQASTSDLFHQLHPETLEKEEFVDGKRYRRNSDGIMADSSVNLKTSGGAAVSESIHWLTRDS